MPMYHRPHATREGDLARVDVRAEALFRWFEPGQALSRLLDQHVGSDSPEGTSMASIMHVCKWVGTAASIWLGVAATAQARVLLLEDTYDPGEQVVAEFKACRIAETGPLKFPPLLKHRLTADASPPIRIAMASPARAARPSLPLLIGVGF
jgi:hypothetical protein